MNLPTTLQLVQGRSKDFSRQTANDDGSVGGIYTGTELITYTIWPADSEVVVLTATGSPNAWINASLTQWFISFDDAQTATLTPGIYRIEVTAPVMAGRTGTLFEGLLEVISTAGTTVVSPPDLATAYYVIRQLGQINLTNIQVEMLPDTITAASQLIRKWCGDRIFTRMTLTGVFPVANNGMVRLDQIPVNQVLRVQAQPQVAMTISNNGTGITNARAYFAFTGDFASGQTITGITFVSVASGVATTQTITYTPNMVVNDLATAVNSLGNGWLAQTIQSPYGGWPVTELIGLTTAQGALQPEGINLQVYGQDLDNAYLIPYGQETGMLYTGLYGVADPIGPRWGPGWEQYATLGSSTTGRVKVTYDAGFDTIPPAIQQATAELAKAILQRMITNPYLESETAGQYTYRLALIFYDNIPRPIRQTIQLYRLHQV